MSPCMHLPRENQIWTTITGIGDLCDEPYTTLDEWYRSESVGTGRYCDKDTVDGTSWYRFNLSIGEKSVLEHCPGFETCGTGLSIWMNCTHTERYGVIKDVTICMYLRIRVIVIMVIVSVTLALL